VKIPAGRNKCTAASGICGSRGALVDVHVVDSSNGIEVNGGLPDFPKCDIEKNEPGLPFARRERNVNSNEGWIGTLNARQEASNQSRELKFRTQPSIGSRGPFGDPAAAGCVEQVRPRTMNPPF